MNIEAEMIKLLREQNALLRRTTDRQADIIKEFRGELQILEEQSRRYREENVDLRADLQSMQEQMAVLLQELYRANRELQRLLTPLREARRDAANLPENRPPTGFVNELIDVLEGWKVGAPDWDAEKATDLFQCSRCKSAVYASKEEQIADWSRHKNVCTPPGGV